MKKLLILVFLSYSAFAQVGGESSRSAGGSSQASTNWSAPSFEASDLLSGTASNFLGFTCTSSDEVLNQDKFKPQLKTNTNRGSLSVEFKVPMPANILKLENLTFEYNHHRKTNYGFGIGFDLRLPTLLISSHRDIDLINFSGAGNYTPSGCDIQSDYLNWAHSKLLNNSTLEECYKARLDEKFFVIMKYKSGYILYTREQKHLVFDLSGRLTYRFDNFKNYIKYNWSESTLDSIQSSFKSWFVKFNYSGIQKFKLFRHSKLRSLPNSLSSISFSTKAKTKTALFDYDNNQYLSKAYWKGAHKPLFHAKYEKLSQSIKQTSKLPSLKYEIDPNTKEKVYSESFVHQLDPNEPIIVKKTKGFIEYFIDLNCDGREDKVQINIDQLNSKITASFPSYHVSGNSRSSCHAYPSQSISWTNTRLNNVKLPVSFYWASVTQDGQFSYIKDESLSSREIKIAKFVLEVKESKSDDCNKITYYDIKSVSYSVPKVIDLNNDQLNDILWCRGGENISKSLADGSILSLRGNPSTQWILGINENKVSPHLMNNQYLNVVPSIWRIEEGPGQVCHSYSQITDFNNDGQLDILNGANILLSSGLGFEKLEFTSGEVDKYFKIVDKSPTVLIKDDGFYKAMRAEAMFSDLSGLYVQTKNETTYIQPGSSAELLKSYYTPFGGEYRVSYENTLKTQMVKSIEKLDRSGETHYKKEFEYSGEYLDIYTGDFVGFSTTMEKVMSSALPGVKTITRSYLKDNSTDVLLFGGIGAPSLSSFGARARFQGRLLSHSVGIEGQKGDFATTIYRYNGDLINKDSHRFYLYTSLIEKYNKDSQGRVVEVISDTKKINFLRELPSSIETKRFYGDDLVSLSRIKPLESTKTSLSLNSHSLLLKTSQKMTIDGLKIQGYFNIILKELFQDLHLKIWL